MKRTKADIGRLIAELRLDCEAVEELAETNARAQQRIANGSRDSLDYAALGYSIHNIYGVVENACFRISKFFENGLSQDSWHKDLLNRMLLDIPGTRPSFLSRQAFLILDELRAFRHVFRNLYNRPLDIDRLTLLQEKVPEAVKSFKESVRRYEAFLSRLRDELEA